LLKQDATIPAVQLRLDVESPEGSKVTAFEVSDASFGVFLNGEFFFFFLLLLVHLVFTGVLCRSQAGKGNHGQPVLSANPFHCTPFLQICLFCFLSFFISLVVFSACIQ